MHAPAKRPREVFVSPDGTGVDVDPAWDRARELLAEGRRCARELAAEIERLRAEYSTGHGGARRGSSSQLVNLKQGEGFVAQLRAQLQLHPEQARRLLLDAQRERQIYAIASGEVEVVEDESGARPVTEEVREAAQQAVRAIEADPGVRPARAWAGLWGRAATAGRARREVDHAANIARGITALKTSLAHWAEFTPRERAALEQAWADLVLPVLPQTWRRE